MVRLEPSQTAQASVFDGLDPRRIRGSSTENWVSRAVLTEVEAKADLVDGPIERI